MLYVRVSTICQWLYIPCRQSFKDQAEFYQSEYLISWWHTLINYHNMTAFFWWESASVLCWYGLNFVVTPIVITIFTDLRWFIYVESVIITLIDDCRFVVKLADFRCPFYQHVSTLIPESVGWNYLSIPKLQRCNRWNLGMNKKFHLTHYWKCDYLSMVGLKLNHAGKKAPFW